MSEGGSILVTGGAGFIGSNFILDWMGGDGAGPVVNLDRLSYAGNPANLREVAGRNDYTFVHGDIRDGELGRGAAPEASAGGDCALRGGEPCGPIDPGAGGVSAHQH